MSDPANRSEPAAADLVYVRILDAPRELVFRCLLEPEHLTHFWGPVGVSAPLEDIHVDARPGGFFETVMVNDRDGSRYPTRAVYDEISPPDRLVWTETGTGMRTTTTFTVLADGRTEVRIHQSNVPHGFDDARAREGFRTSLERFAGHLQALAEDRP